LRRDGFYFKPRTIPIRLSAMSNLQPNARALVLIDVQKAIDAAYWAAVGPRNNPGAERAMAAVLAAWRDAALPIFHVRHDSRTAGSAYRPGQPGHAFKDEAVPEAGEPVIAKSTNSAFIGTGLERILRERGIRQLWVMGVITNNSVESTVRMAGNLGFETYLIEDGCFTFAKLDYRGVPRSADEVHALSLANLHGEYATVVTSRDAVAAAVRSRDGRGKENAGDSFAGPVPANES
jgi:nicotinamidase-related amidase